MPGELMLEDIHKKDSVEDGKAPRYREQYPCCRLLIFLLHLWHSRAFPRNIKKEEE